MSLPRLAALSVLLAATSLPMSAFSQDTAPVSDPAAPPSDTPAAPPPEDSPAASEAPLVAPPAEDAPPSAAAPPAAAAPQMVIVRPADGRVGAPPAGMGQIVFFRPSRFSGAALHHTVREDTLEIDRLHNGRFFILATTPGEHTYNVRSETTDNFSLEVEAGETYYVQLTIEFGIVMARPNLSPSDEATFQRYARGMRLSDWRSEQPNSPSFAGAAASR